MAPLRRPGVLWLWSVAGVASLALGGQLTTRASSMLRIPALPLGLRLTDIELAEGRLLLDAATGPS